MTNLLPQESQRAIIKEYKRRRMTVFLVFLICIIVVSAGFLLPSYILSDVKLIEMKLQEESARLASQRLDDENNTSSTLLKEMAHKVAFLNQEQVRSAEVVISTITSNKSEDIKIQSITYARSEGNSLGTVDIQGLAKDRDSLTLFLNAMEGQELFESVDLPVSNFAKDRDILFSMRITGTF